MLPNTADEVMWLLTEADKGGALKSDMMAGMFTKQDKKGTIWVAWKFMNCGNGFGLLFQW